MGTVSPQTVRNYISDYFADLQKQLAKTRFEDDDWLYINNINSTNPKTTDYDPQEDFDIFEKNK